MKILKLGKLFLWVLVERIEKRYFLVYQIDWEEVLYFCLLMRLKSQMSK